MSGLSDIALSTGETTIDDHTLANLLLCSFRYSLGRMTYITGDCADWLTRYWHLMPSAWKKQIHGDIEKAIERNEAGMTCDIASWRRVLALPLDREGT
ncbi:hypothetical protein TA3x_000402 [Tundrisphaera sp. TA3]|uniref:hypothetical protein n=1 Tax=Tundrisphaera sp. TA3 TaxID=3435775 RepID=UPI003EB75116